MVISETERILGGRWMTAFLAAYPILGRLLCAQLERACIEKEDALDSMKISPSTTGVLLSWRPSNEKLWSSSIVFCQHLHIIEVKWLWSIFFIVLSAWNLHRWQLVMIPPNCDQNYVNYSMLIGAEQLCKLPCHILLIRHPTDKLVLLLMSSCQY